MPKNFSKEDICKIGVIHRPCMTIDKFWDIIFQPFKFRMTFFIVNVIFEKIEKKSIL